MIVILNSLEWPFLFKFREAASSGKALKQNQLEKERQPVLSSVLTYFVTYFFGGWLLYTWSRKHDSFCLLGSFALL